MKELPKFFDYKTKEPEIAENWKIGKFYKFAGNTKEPSFKIDTPPPTVSGSLHMGHVFSYVQADIIARYKRLMGFNVFYPIGFDDNGLPTERLVEKLTAKKVGRDCSKEDFVKLCHEIVSSSEKDFEELFKQIGLSVDFDLKYQTISEKTAEISQKSFIDLQNKGLIYQKLAPVYWDTVDKTALAQADIEDKEIEGFQIIYKAFSEGKEFAIMTTRPEMLPACVSVFFHPEDERYSHLKDKIIELPFGIKVPMLPDEDVSREKGTGLVMCCAFGDMQDKIWIERHNLWNKIPHRSESSETQNLINDVGLLIDNLFLKEDGKFMKVEEGRKFIIEKLLQEGLIEGSVQGAELEASLKSIEVSVSQVTHSVKCGERSGKPVEILFKNQWYLSVLAFKRDLLEVIKKINFHPAHMKVKLERWIEGLNQDWCISRDRFFGISIPVRNFEWQDNVSRETLENIKKDFFAETFASIVQQHGGIIHENHFEMEPEVLVNLMETPEYLGFEDSFAISGLDLEIKNIGIAKYELSVNRNLDGLFQELLGKDSKEKIILTDEECKNLERLISEKDDILKEIGISALKIKTENLVLDTWFTSSISPQIAWNSFEETPVFDLRPQAHEIIRTWAFYTIVKSYLHSLELKNPEKKPDALREFNSREFFRIKEGGNIIPWKNVMLSGWCLAADKTKMSKSKGNVVTPVELIKEKGVDTIRLWCGSASLGTDTAYNEEFLEIGKKFTNKLWNVAKFFFLKAHQLKASAEITEAFDKWILAKFSQTLAEYHVFMENFEYSKAKEVMDNFFWKDLCDNYLEIIKIRYYGLEALIYKENQPHNPEEVIKKQQSAIKTLSIIFEGILKVYAPFIPFITEELYFEFKGTSVHSKGSLKDLTIPTFTIPNYSNESLEIIEAVRKYKSENSLAMNATLEEFHVKHFQIEFLEDLINVTGVKKFQTT
jgi:valyl-tRNA synthetase